MDARTNTQRGKLIKLDHVEFEKLFVVYGDDPIESRYLLTAPSLMEIVHFRTKVGKPVYLSFVDGKLYMAMHYTKTSLCADIKSFLARL